MRARTATAAATGALLLLVVTAPAASAKRATVTGKAPAASAKLYGRSMGTVAAVGAETSRMLGTARLRKGVRYTLKVAPGAVVVLTPIVSKSGRVKVASSRIARLRSGKRRSLNATRRRPRPRRRRAGAAQAGRHIVKYSVHGSKVTNAPPGLSDHAVDEMMHYETWVAGEKAPCTAEQYVDRESDDFKAIQAEVALQQSPQFDPRTRVTPKWHLPRYTPTSRISIQMTVGADGNTVSGRVTARGIKTGRTISIPVSGTVSSFFFSDDTPNALDQALDALFAALCFPTGLEQISGTFSGDSTIPPGSKYSWNGSVVFKRLGGSQAPGATGSYPVGSGLVTYAASGQYPYAACQMSGTMQFNLPPNSGTIGVTGSPPNGLEPYDYGIHVPVPFPGTMDVTLSSCAPGAESLEGTTQTVPVGSDPLAPRQQYRSDDGLAYQGSESQTESGVSVNYSWSLKGEEPG